MLNITRRGTASVAASLLSLSTYSRCSGPAYTRALQRCLSWKPPSTGKSFRGTYQWKRTAATSAAAKAEATEGEMEQEVFSQTPPSDPQIKEAVKRGPVTKFKELAEHGMVCQTVVNTITQDMGLETMTQVQSLTISQSLKGKDM